MTREHILREIKRLASKSDGQAPGRDMFLKATGIKEWDWNKYWPRWNDAVREAGLAPNQMGKSYGDDYLIEKVIGLARELGHFPVKNDYRIKSYNEKGFPSEKTFERFGLKSVLVAKVAEHCRTKGGLEDVLQMCANAVSRTAVDKSEDDLADGDVPVGFVYLIRSGKYHKIGKTKSIGRREYDLAIQLAEKPTTIHVIKTDDPDGVEAYWHRRFAAKRKNGEWFALNSTDVKAFKKWIRIA
jgi:hypothetical protein